jgi:hypothetical protein
MKYGNEGPRQQNIPAQSITTCSGCKHFHSRLVKSGRDPIYAKNCEHPDVKGDDSHLVMFGLAEGNLKEDENGWTVTPEWCPFRAENSKK